MSRRIGVLVLALAAAACGADERAAPPPGGADGGGGAGGAEPVREAAYHVSFVPEVGPGAGPALLRMTNDTPADILSITLPTGEAFAFYLVEPGATTAYAPIASADMLEDAILSYHTNDTCVRRPFAEMNGPLSLEPGRAYTLRVGADDGYIATITDEGIADPYVGVRVLIDDRALPTEVGAASLLTLTLAGADQQAFEDVYDELPSPFSALDLAALSVEQIRFVDLSGVEHTAAGPSLPDDVFGYTIHVAAEPVAGAVVVPVYP